MSISKDVLLNQYIPFNKQVPYKDFYISPIRLSDFAEVSMALNVLEIDKNTLGQLELISMSYLRFVLFAIDESEEIANSFEALLRKSLNIADDYTIQKYIGQDEEFLIVGKVLHKTQGNVIFDENTARKITAEDFDEIKRVVLYQNFYDYDEKYIDPDVKKAADEYHRLKNKGAKKVTLEHKMICVQAKTGMTLEEIGNLTIRNFQQLFDVIVDEDDYIINKSAELGGSVKFKEPIEHWAYKEKKDKYAEAFCDADSFVGQIQSAN